MLEALIKVIPKPGKGRLLVKNYRPVSLLNVDLKVFTLILADILNRLLDNSLYKVQVGFIL